MCQVLLAPVCIVGQVIAGEAGSVAGAAAGQAASGVLSGIAASVESGVAFIVSGSIDWWVRIPSPDLAGEPAVARLQQWMLPFSAAVAVLGMIIAGGRMALTRKATPLADVGSGLVIIAATSAVGVLLPQLLLKAGDAWSDWVLTASTGGQFGARLTGILVLGGPQAAPAAVVVLGIIGIVISAIQAGLMLFRQGAIVVLAGLMPLAAAGTLNPATRPWFRKVTGWMLALVMYKPAAAAVYATAFTLIGTGTDLQTVLTGFSMVVMSLLALPVLMRFFTWTTGAIADSASGGGFLQTALSGAAAVGAARGTGSGAAGQARMMAGRLGPQPAGTGPAASMPAGAASAGTAARAGAAAASGAGAASSAAAAAGAAGGPAGLAASGLAAGASAARAAGQAMQPGSGNGAGQ